MLCAAVFIGPRLADSQGFVHIATDTYIVETSLTTASIILVVSFFVLHFVLNLIMGSVKIPKITANWFSKRSSKKKIALQNEAFLAYEEGAYARSLALIKKAGSEKEVPANCLLLAAKCAFNLNDLDACRNYIDQAEKHSSTSIAACKILRAKLNIKVGNTQAAIDNLDEIKRDSYTSAISTKLLYECYTKENNFEKLHELVTSLKKHDLATKEEIEKINSKYIDYRLNKASSIDEINAVVNSLDRNLRQDPSVMGPIIRKMVELGDLNHASKYATKILAGHSTPEFLESIATWKMSVPSVLNELQKMVQNNAIGSQINVPLLKALANLELQSGQLTEAQGHLNQALEISKTPDLYLMAARVNENLKQFEDATKFFSLAVK